MGWLIVPKTPNRVTDIYLIVVSVELHNVNAIYLVQKETALYEGNLLLHIHFRPFAMCARSFRFCLFLTRNIGSFMVTENIS
jgi:hypothetical protein